MKDHSFFKFSGKKNGWWTPKGDPFYPKVWVKLTLLTLLERQRRFSIDIR